CYRSQQIAAKDKRRGGPAHLIVRISPPDFSKTRTAIKSKRRDIALVDLEKNAARAERGEPAQMGLEQLPPQASPTPGGGHSNPQAHSPAQNARSQDEPVEVLSRRGAVRQHISIRQQALEFVLAPSAMKRGRMQRRQGASVGWGRFRQPQLPGE